MQIKLFQRNPWLISLATYMSIIPLVSSDIYVPVLPNIAEYFHVSSFSVKSSLTIFLLGFGIGQLLYGFFSDSFGRKKMLLYGMAIYFFATLFCIFSKSILMLDISRFFQGLGVCSGAVIGRVLIVDNFDAKESAIVFTMIFPFIGLSPAISPMIGGIVTSYLSWHYTFVLLAILALCLCVLVILRLKEGVADREVCSFVSYVRHGASFLKDPQYLCYLSFVCGAYTAWFTFITESSFIFHSSNFSPFQIGMMYTPLAIAYVLGNICAKTILKVYQIQIGIKVGIICYVLGVLILYVNIFYVNTLIVTVSGMCIIVFGNGFLLPLGTAGALSSAKSGKGGASAILGFFQLGSATLGSIAVAWFSSSSIKAVAFLLCIYAAIMLFFYISLVRIKRND